MKKMIIEPKGWPCTLVECPPGFFVYEDHLCLKSEYGANMKPEAFNCAGEYFCAGDQVIVQPVVFNWIDEEAMW